MPRPILVTGSHRSGTTWTGALLGLSGEALPIHEPFNPIYPRSWLPDPPERWFEHVISDESAWRDGLRHVTELKPPAARMLRRQYHPVHAARVVEEAARAWSARRRGARALIKDPIAFFSAEWIAREFDADVVVLVRHPAAFASSLKRLAWRFDFENFTSQPALMSRFDSQHRAEIERASKEPPDMIDTASLLWRAINAAAVRYRDEHPEWVVERYEDLASAPVDRFRSLYDRVGLSWTSDVAAAVRDHTQESNVTAVDDHDKGGVVRDSRAAMWTWKDRLDADEIERVRDATSDVWPEFYDADDWTSPH